MYKIIKIACFGAIFSATGLMSIAGCASRPALKNVDTQAQAQPVNTPEQAQRIRQQQAR